MSPYEINHPYTTITGNGLSWFPKYVFILYMFHVSLVTKSYKLMNIHVYYSQEY